MSKGLEALKKIKWKLEDEGILGEEYELCSLIEKELERLEELDNGAYASVHINRYNELCDKEKALEILKKHIRIAKPFDLETKEEEPFEIFDIDLWHEGKQKEDFEFVKEVLDL